MEVKPGYKRSELGVIPVDWDAVPMQAITTHIGDGLHGTPVYSSHGDYFFINGNNLNAGKIVISGDTQSVDHSEFMKHRKPLSDRSILMSINGTIGNLGLFEGEPVVLGKSAAYLNVKSGISRQFVYHSLQTSVVRQQFFEGLTGTTIGNLGLATIRRCQIPLPNTEGEQRSIATVLSDVDGLVAGLDRLIAKKRDLKQAAMQQLLTGQTRLPGFRGKWEVKTLGDVANVLKGNALSKSLVTASGTRPCILYGDLFTTYDRVISQIVGHTNSSEGCPSVSGDVLMPGSTTTTGIDLATASALLLDNVALGGDILIIRQKPNAYDSVFLANYLTHSRRHQIAELTQGITIHHLYGKDLKNLLLELPSVLEQTAIAEVLTDMDAELAALEKRREKIFSLKQAMMQELLTGKTRLVSTTGDRAR
ncbi:MAG TPA: restriction endonuclease subunit S [Chthoniobacterales bacterium]|jgi:type I restriction enzyme S subunit|nr:restriction endonuclease subunit S [Chthoniobacterales bacterium]